MVKLVNNFYIFILYMKIINLLNGLSILFIPLKSLTVSIGFFIKAGARFENNINNGIAHYLEHMMFRGTINRPSTKLLLEMEKMGAKYNASTSYEFTFYEIHGNYKDGIHLLDIMVDLYLNPAFEENDINIEKGVVIEEINMSLDKPDNLCMDDMHKIVYKNSGLGRTVLGSRDNIIGINKNDLINFRKTHYIPSNTVICIAGNFKQDLIEKQLKQIFEPINYTDPYRDKIFISKQKEPEITISYDDTISQTLIMFGFRSVGLKDIRTYHFDILASILSGGTMSRLFILLRNKMGVSYFNKSYQDTNTDCGLFRVYMGIENKRVNEVIHVVLKEFKKFKEELVDDEELNRVKKSYETGMLFKLQTPEEYMIHYGLNYLFNGKDMKDLEEELNIYKNVSSQNIKDISNEFLTLERLNISIYGSVDKNELKKSLSILI
jgi:predicted Zn-dependent peptidase